jgi:hypothetical protein
MRFSVKIYPQAQKRRGCTTLTLLWKLMAALGLGPGKPVTAVVSPGVVIICRPEWVPVFERLLHDFPGAFISDPERALSKQAGGVGE